MTAIKTTSLVAALVAMRGEMLAPDLVAGGWAETGENPAPLYPYVELEVEPSDWDAQTFQVTETIFADTTSQGREIADALLDLSDRSYKPDDIDVDIRGHVLTSGPRRVRTYDRVAFELVWNVTAIWTA